MLGRDWDDNMACHYVREGLGRQHGLSLCQGGTGMTTRPVTMLGRD